MWGTPCQGLGTQSNGANGAELVDFHLEVIHPSFAGVGFQVFKRRDHHRVGDHQEIVYAGADFGGNGLGDMVVDVLEKSTQRTVNDPLQFPFGRQFDPQLPEPLTGTVQERLRAECAS